MQVQHIAKLARIGISDAEVAKYQEDLSSILDFVDQLRQVDVTDVEPMHHTTQAETVMRRDVPAEYDEKTKQELVAAAPQSEGRHVKVKSVFENRE